MAKNVSADPGGGLGATELEARRQSAHEWLRHGISIRFVMLTLAGVMLFTIGALAQASAAIAADFDRSLIEATDRVVRVAERLMASGTSTREALTQAVRMTSAPHQPPYLFGPRSEPLHVSGSNRWVLRWTALEAQLQGSYQSSYVPPEGDPVRLYARRVDVPGEGEYVVMAAAQGTTVKEQQSALTRRYMGLLLVTLAPLALLSARLSRRPTRTTHVEF